MTDSKAMKLVKVSVTDDVYDELKRVANATMRSRSQIIRLILQRVTQDPELLKQAINYTLDVKEDSK